MHKVKINSKYYFVNDDEFVKVPHNEFNNLVILDKVGEQERIISLINECSCFTDNLIVVDPTHGGFIPLNCASSYNNAYVTGSVPLSFYTNLNLYYKNIYVKEIEEIPVVLIPVVSSATFFVFSQTALEFSESMYNFIQDNEPILLTSYFLRKYSKKYNHIYRLTNTDLFLYVPDSVYKRFHEEFKYYIVNEGELAYDR